MLAFDAASPISNTRLAYAFAGVCPDVELNWPNTASLEDTCTVSPAVVVEITACPPEFNHKLVPALNVPAETADAMAVCRVAMVDDVPAVKEKVCPVEASTIEMIEPFVSDVPTVRGADTLPAVELAELDGSDRVNTALRFATLLSLLEPAEVIASKAGSLIDTLIPEAASLGFAGIENRLCPGLPLESVPCVWASLKALESWLASAFSCNNIPGST